MALTSEHHSVDVRGSTVTVAARSGLVHAAWRLEIDGEIVDRAEAAGDFTLRGSLPDGTDVVAAIHQSLLGPTEVTVSSEGAEVATFTGFVA